MKKIALFITTAAIALASCGGGKQNAATDGADTLSGTIQISGAFALYPLVVQWADEFKALHPNVQIDISGGGAGKGMTDVLSNMVDLGMVSRNVYDEELGKGAYPFAVAKDVVIPTINAKNPLLKEIKAHGLTAEKARQIWSDELKTWGEVLDTNASQPLHVYTRSDACGAAETFAHWFDMKQEQLKGTGVYGDPGLAAAIQKDPVGIGMNNIAYAYDAKTRKLQKGLEVAPIDVNGDGKITADEEFYDDLDKLGEAVRNGTFPAPPARSLFLVANGKPTKPVLVAFIDYLLTKGQESCTKAGFVELTKEQQSEQLAKLK